MSLTLFVGSNDSNLAKEALSTDPSAYLINSDNYNQQHNGVCYTSISDLKTTTEFASLLRQADSIIYVPDPSWVPGEKVKEYSERYWIERYLYTFSLFDKTKKIVNCPIPCLPTNYDLILALNAQRKNNEPHLWVSGCSTSLGVGVEIRERYANILAEKLNLPLCMLAKPGASVAYTADQILRSDIRKGDLVILGITTCYRKTYYNPDAQMSGKFNYFDLWKARRAEEETPKIIHATPGKLKEQNIKIDLTDPTLLYDSIIAVYQVLNFCQAVNAKLILVGMHAEIEFATYLKDIPAYIHVDGFYGIGRYDKFIDFGSDLQGHPGPLMHQLYAEKILDKLKRME